MGRLASQDVVATVDAETLADEARFARKWWGHPCATSNSEELRRGNTDGRTSTVLGSRCGNLSLANAPPVLVRSSVQQITFSMGVRHMSANSRDAHPFCTLGQAVSAGRWFQWGFRTEWGCKPVRRSYLAKHPRAMDDGRLSLLNFGALKRFYSYFT